MIFFLKIEWYKISDRAIFVNNIYNIAKIIIHRGLSLWIWEKLINLHICSQRLFVFRFPNFINAKRAIL